MTSEREIIADEVERMMKSMSLLNGEELSKATQEMGRLVYVHSSQVIAALRAKDREDGAREMRERAEAACLENSEQIDPRCDFDSGFGAGLGQAAIIVAALPLTPKESGDAQ